MFKNFSRTMIFYCFALCGIFFVSNTLLGDSATPASDQGKGTSSKKNAGRKKILTGEAHYKAAGVRKGQKTSIDFDEAQIDGQRKTPTGVAITKTRPDQEYDLINLRLSWHPEMIESTSQLETGKGR